VLTVEWSIVPQKYYLKVENNHGRQQRDPMWAVRSRPLLLETTLLLLLWSLSLFVVN
jgi:hypothetical protein